MRHAPMHTHSPPPQRQRNETLALIALSFGLVVNFIPDHLPGRLGEEITFLGWLTPLVVCSYVAWSNRMLSYFPLRLWLPWCTWVLVYLSLSSYDNALQRCVMMLTPLIVGVAFSSFRADAAMLARCYRWMNGFIWLYLLSVTIGGAGAPTVITASLLATWVAVDYSYSANKRGLLVWALLAIVPVYFVARMGMIAVALTMPLTFAPLSLLKRVIFIGVLAVAGISAFQIEKVQEKMFFSGSGSISNAFESVLGMLTGKDTVSDDFRTNAREDMNLVLSEQVKDAYWFGHGANATEIVTSTYFDGLTHPHNDWLRIQHEYGTLGMLIFAITLLVQAIHSWRVARLLEGKAAQFMLAGASAFIPMAMFMMSDNVILYVAWFGNLQFAMLGLGYAAFNKSAPEAAKRAFQ